MSASLSAVNLWMFRKTLTPFLIHLLKSSSEASVAISAVQLYAQYEANEVEADNKYKGKVLAVTGVAGDIGKDIMDEAYVLLSSGDALGMFGVQCFFSESEEQNFSNLRTGQQLTIKGRCDGKFGNVFLKDCTFQ